MTRDEFHDIVCKLGFQKHKEYTDTAGNHDVSYTFDMCRNSESISIVLEKDNTVKIWFYGTPSTTFSSRGMIVMSEALLVRDLDRFFFTSNNVSGLEKKYYMEKRIPFLRNLKLEELGI